MIECVDTSNRGITSMLRGIGRFRVVSPPLLLVFLTVIFVLELGPPIPPRSPTPAYSKTRDGRKICVDIEGDDYVAIVRTKTEPAFYISLHREKDDIPRAPIRYTGLYYEEQRTSQMHAFMNMSDKRMDGIFLDVGANIGWFTLYAAAMGRHVVAFEPSPMNLLRLNQGIQANGFDNVLVKPFGAGPTDSLLYFRKAKDNYGGGTFYLNWTGNDTDVTRLYVKRVTDELKNVPTAWNHRVAIVKVDVEGFEAGAIEGMMGTLEKDLPVVFLEFSNWRPSSNHYYEVVKTFLDLGYRPYKQQPLPNSIDALIKWFEDAIHPSRGPVDMLFLPAWMSDDDIPSV